MKTFSSIIKNIFSTHQKVECTIKEPSIKPVERVVIDGQNVMYGSTSDQRISLLNLLGLVVELNNRKIPTKCFFDANTFFTLTRANRKDEAYAYRRLCHDFPDLFIEVPGHNRADDFLLDYANSSGESIISNDQYRDFYTKYGWIADSQRRFSFLIHSGIIQIVTLGISASIPTKLSDAENILRDQIGRITGKFVPTNAPVKINRTNNHAKNKGKMVLSAA